ncbi:MAG TPA: CBS domain-containing protein [Anaerolineales bacterium]|nr:CBS domain-containing protein [Anaerolineales bacterium]
MKLSEIMTTSVEMVQPDDTLQLAARKMRDRDIGFLPVCDGGMLMGVLSDRDLAIRALAEGMDTTVMLSRDLMTTPAIYGYEDQDITEAAKIMEANQIRRLVIISREDQSLVGVVSLGDIARHTSPELSGEVLQRVSEPDTVKPVKEEPTEAES